MLLILTSCERAAEVPLDPLVEDTIIDVRLQTMDDLPRMTPPICGLLASDSKAYIWDADEEWSGKWTSVGPYTVNVDWSFLDLGTLEFVERTKTGWIIDFWGHDEAGTITAVEGCTAYAP